MRRYNTTGTYSGRRSYSPGIMQYSSPTSSIVNPLGTRNGMNQRPNHTVAPHQSMKEQQRS